MCDKTLPLHYSGKYEGSFAYRTIKDRLPVILVKVLDALCQNKASITTAHGETGKEHLKEAIGRLSALQYEMITNKPFKPLESDGPDVVLWNNFLKDQNANNNFEAAWYESSWLYAECYLYKRISEVFEGSECLKGYDPFYQQKVESFLLNMDAAAKLATMLQGTIENLPKLRDRDELYKIFQIYLEVSLWSNKCDLSLASGQSEGGSCQVEALRDRIFVNDALAVWGALQARPGGAKVAFVLDNAGFELFCDLCLLHLLQASGLVSRVALHVKRLPWFVSDVLEGDLQWLLQTLLRSKDAPLVRLAEDTVLRLTSGQWTVEKEIYWTLPHDYSEMATIDPGLYSKLRESDLVIFKGDLNYRKLTGDRQWPETTPFREALCGFLPSPLVTLRTIKADVLVGIPEGVLETLSKLPPDSRHVGDYAVVQFARPNG